MASQWPPSGLPVAPSSSQQLPAAPAAPAARLRAQPCVCCVWTLCWCFWCFPCPWPGCDGGGNVSHSYQVIHCPGPVLSPPSSRARWEDPEPSFLFFQSLQHCQKGKGTIWLALVYCTPCQFELINHIYPSILITPCLATCLALSC